MSIGKTSSEVKNRWNATNYKRFTISLRIEEDKEIIQFLEKSRSENKKIVSDIFRLGYENFKKEGL